jgi:intracellular sulfur oxidation DsrE/DsrF family protein
MSHQRSANVVRRSFLSRFAAGTAAAGAVLVGARTVAAQSPAAGWQPARHAEDDWFDETAAKHRFFMDTTSPAAFGQALFFARNVFSANASGYGLKDADIAQIICVRHQSTSFAFIDEMWAKYGAALSARAGDFVDPKTKQIPATNLYRATGYGEALTNSGVTIDAMARRGVRLAVCAMATRATAQLIAQRGGGTADAVFKELTEHLVPNSHMVPAGIVAVNRAQERGYTFSYVT